MSETKFTDPTPLFELWKTYLETHRKPKLYILTPCYGNMCQVNYVESLLTTTNAFMQIGLDYQVEFCRNDSLVTRARNNLIAKAMSDAECTHMIFIDGDITWEVTDILRLMMHDKEIVGGLYPLKHYFFDKMFTDTPETSKYPVLVDRYNRSITKSGTTFHNYVKQNMMKYNCNYIGDTVDIQNNLIEVMHIATGFMMLKRECIEKMMEKFPERKYVDDVGFLTEKHMEYTYAHFNTGVVDNHFYSEDWMFCHDWRSLGGQIFADVTINLLHSGCEDFAGSYLSTIL